MQRLSPRAARSGPATSRTCSCGMGRPRANRSELSRHTSHRELRQRERRPNQVHVAVAVQLRVSSKVVKLRRFLKEGFHFSGGLEGYKDLSRILANVRPDVWHLSWGKQRITRLQPHA